MSCEWCGGWKVLFLFKVVFLLVSNQDQGQSFPGNSFFLPIEVAPQRVVVECRINGFVSCRFLRHLPADGHESELRVFSVDDRRKGCSGFSTWRAFVGHSRRGKFYDADMAVFGVVGINPECHRVLY